MNKFRKVLLIISVILLVALVVLLIISNNSNNSDLDFWFKAATTVTITVSLSFSLTLNFTLNKTIVSNSFNTINIGTKNDQINNCFESCYKINSNISLIVEMINSPKNHTGINFEEKINDLLKHIKDYCDDIKVKLSPYSNDTSITLNDSKRIAFINDYVGSVAILEQFHPFRWMNLPQIIETNKQMKQVLIVLKDKYEKYIQMEAK